MRLRRTLLAPVSLLIFLAAIGTAHGAAVIHLPYPAGVSVSILQGYNGGTHQGVERYSLDLVRDDGKTSNSPALAPAAGTVVWAYAPGTLSGCIGIQIDDGGGLYEMLCHLFLNHTYANGEHVSAGQVLGTVGPPGTVENNGTPHIHLQEYRTPNGVRTPEPFASPDGAPLEGVTLPIGDGSYNEWACTGTSGPGCHIVSQNGAAATPGGTATPGRITSASTGSSAGATLSGTQQQTPLGIGVPVAVTGTGDCLNIHDQPTISGNDLYCLPDGTQAVIADGPISADGYTWWKLDDLGWGDAQYLAATGSANSVAAPATTPSPAATATPTAVRPPPPNTGTMPPPPAPPTPPTNRGIPAPPTPATPAPAATPAVPTMLPTGVAFSAGQGVVVSGTGDCLHVRDQPSLQGNVLDCLTDGTTGVIVDGPVQADGLVWWDLDGEGWVDGQYLSAQ